ncbi:Microtubule-associated protein, microtubule dynamics during spindle orientation [Phlyctochytrium bullatum]|nr:Microtubule-associated protein, microtubule dynamics during spindle orientation [Phlyctochytrium bullatum]
MADGADEDFSGLPLTERLAHKSWKARQGAYEELAKLFRTLDPDNDAEYRKYQEYLKKMAGDANIAAQEAGLNAVLSYVENAPSGPKTRNVIVPLLVDKALGAARQTSKAKAIEIILMYIEVENKADGVIEDLLPGLDHKTPKNVVACITAMREAVRLFGVKVVNIKPILKHLVKVFDHKDKNVRAEATALTVEIYRWVGAALMPSIGELKPVQLKDLQELFDSLSGDRPRPERLVRAEQAKREARGGAAEIEDEGDAPGTQQAEPEPVDPFDLSDPVNVLDKMANNFYTELASTKWKERKEALEGLLALVKAPKLEDGRYGELLNVLAKRVNDANILVATLSINCIDNIARGLRTAFAPYRGIVLSALLEKLKEKKATVIEAIRQALDALFLSISFPEVMEDVTSSAGHKNPQVKCEVLQWMVRCLKATKKPPGKPELKALAELGVKAMDDGDANVRDASAELLGTLMRVVGERLMVSYMERLDKTKEAKVKEYFEKAEVRIGGAAPKKKPPAAAASSSPSQNKENTPPTPDRPKYVPSKPITKSATSAAPKKPASSSSSAASSRPASSVGPKPDAAKKKAGGASAAAPAAEETISFRYSEESADTWMQQNMTEVTLAEIGDSNWKTRLAAMQALLEVVKTKDPKSIEAEAVIRYLLKTPGWKESNFQVMTALVNVLMAVAKCPSFTKGVASLAAPGLCDKISDMKVKKVASECLTVFAEAASFQFVLSQCYEPFKKAKSPKTLADGIMWVYQSLMEFGISGLAIRDVIEFAKFALGNSNSAVRNNAVTLLGGLRQFVGPDIKALLGEISPQLMTTIDAEFEKVAAREPPKPTKVQAAPAAAASSGSDDPADELFPRVDLMTVVGQEVLDKLGDAQWKVRKEGLEDLAKILETHKRIKPNLGDLLSALKARLSDSNKNLSMHAVEICGNVAVAMGKAFDRHAKVIFSPMATLLGDQKAHIRAAALTAIENVHTACGLEPCLSSIAHSLMADQPQLRKDLLKWFTEKAAAAKEQGITLSDVQPLVHPTLLCLQDKNAEIRKSASQVLAMLAETVGLHSIEERAGEMFKGTALQTLTTFFDGVRGSSSSGGSKATSATSSAPPKLAGSPVRMKRATTVASGPTSASAGESTGLPKAKTLLASGLPKGKARPATISGSLSLKKEPVDSEPSQPILTTDPGLKEMRASQDRGMHKWTFDAPRRDLVEFLEEQCNGNIFAGIVTLMFSTDHYKEKDFISAISMLDEGITSAMNAGNDKLMMGYVCNSDLILKYLTIRFFDTNTSILIKCLELLEHLFGLLDTHNIMISEYEASAFLPFFINKMGDSKETMRVKIRAIAKQVCRVYPASKFFLYLLDGLKSKNSRTRTECLEEMAEMIKKNGLSVCTPSKAFPVIATQISDSDAKVRNAALGVVTQAYMLVGDTVYKYVGRLPEKDKSLIEEKLKRLPPPSIAAPPRESKLPSAGSSLESMRNAAVRQSVQSLDDMMPSSLARLKDRTQNAGMVGIPGRPTTMYGGISQRTPSSEEPVNFTVRREFSLELDKLKPRTEVGAGSNLLGSQKVSQSLSSLDSLRSQMETPTIPFGLRDQSFNIDVLLSQITVADANESADAVKQMERALATHAKTFGPYLEEVISAFTLQIRLVFTASDLRSPGTSRLCKHLVNFLVQLFSIPELAIDVGIEPMQQCVQELLQRLLDPSLQTMEGGQQLSRALNICMVRILENCDRNKTFSLLLNLLQQSTMEAVKASKEDLPAHVKHTELVMKCLWKMTKVIPSLFEQNQLDAGKLILAIHEFLEISPPSDWKRRAAEKVIPQADMPLRTVKTILNEIVTVFGDKALDYASLISDQERSHAVTYIRQLIQTKKKTDGNAAPTTTDRQPQPATIPPKKIVPESEPPKPKTYSSTGITANGNSGKPESLPLPTPILNPYPVEPALSDEEAEERIRVIFHKMSQKEETKRGIQELHTFRRNHPEAEHIVKRYYDQTSQYFRSYIRRALLSLDNMDSNEAAVAAAGVPSVSASSTSLSSTTSDPVKRSTIPAVGPTGSSYAPQSSSITSLVGSKENGLDRSAPSVNDSPKITSAEGFQERMKKYRDMLSKPSSLAADSNDGPTGYTSNPPHHSAYTSATTDSIAPSGATGAGSSFLSNRSSGIADRLLAKSYSGSAGSPSSSAHASHSGLDLPSSYTELLAKYKINTGDLNRADREDERVSPRVRGNSGDFTPGLATSATSSTFASINGSLSATSAAGYHSPAAGSPFVRSPNGGVTYTASKYEDRGSFGDEGRLPGAVRSEQQTPVADTSSDVSSISLTLAQLKERVRRSKLQNEMKDSL